MSIRTDNTTDWVQGSCPAIGTGAFSWGFSWRPATTTDGQVAFLGNYASPGTGFSLSLEVSGGILDLFTSGLGSATGPTITTGTYYYVLISRAASASIRLRVYTAAGTSTPISDQFTGGDTSTTNLSLSDRSYGAGNGNPAQDQEWESEKWELGVEWSDAEAWAEAQKYALQRAGGTAEIQCDLTTVNADATGLNDVAGTAQSLTNHGCVTGTNHPSYLETLGGGGGSAVVSPFYFRRRSRSSAA